MIKDILNNWPPFNKRSCAWAPRKNHVQMQIATGKNEHKKVSDTDI